MKLIKLNQQNNIYYIKIEYETMKVDPKTDRAEQRRQKVGSSCDYEKTKAASLNAYVGLFGIEFKKLIDFFYV